MSKRYLISASWFFSEQVAQMASALLIGVLIARYLGPTGLGQLSYAQSLVTIVGVFATLGLEGVVIKELIYEPGRRNEILGSAFYLTLFAGVMVALLLIVTVPWSAPSTIERWLVILAAAPLPLQAFNVVRYEYQAWSTIGPVARAQLTQVVLSFFLRAGLLLMSCSVVAFGWARIADALILATLLLTIALSGQLSPLKWRFQWATASHLLHQSWPLIFTGLLVAMFVSIDQVMLRHLVSVQAVGEFSVAVRLTSVLVILPMMIVKAANPAIIASQISDQSLYESRLQLLYDLGVVLSATAAMMFTFLADPLVGLIFGPQYANATSVAVILVWCSIWMTIGQINAVAIIATGDTYQTLIKAMIGVILNIILNYILINHYGITGAAFATLFSYIVAGYLTMSIFPSQRRHFWLATQALILPFAILRLIRFAKLNKHLYKQ